MSQQEVTSTNATLHLVCGKVASGKSTFARKLAEETHAILISEDDWINTLYPDSIKTLVDYVRLSAKIKEVLGPHIIHLLKANVSIVLDMPANSVSTRRWMTNLIQESQAQHQLHYLDIRNEVCKARLRARRQKRKHPMRMSELEFDHVTRYFSAPTEQEGFNVIRYTFEE